MPALNYGKTTLTCKLFAVECRLAVRVKLSEWRRHCDRITFPLLCPDCNSEKRSNIRSALAKQMAYRICKPAVASLCGGVEKCSITLRVRVCVICAVVCVRV